MPKPTPPPDFRKLIESLLHSHSPSTVFHAFVRLAACAVAAGTREAEYLEEAKRWTKDELAVYGKALGALIHEMESKPYEDVLGTHYMEFALSRSGAQWNGEFHTPKAICDLMARVTLTEATLPEAGPIRVSEPACGAGAMILSLAAAMPPDQRRRLRVTAIDVNGTACDMCFINTTLWSIPCHVVHGNTLSGETFAQWHNLFWIMPWLRPMNAPAVLPEGLRQTPAQIVPIAEATRQTIQLELLTA